MAISPPTSASAPHSRISATPPRPSHSPSPAYRAAAYSCRFIPSRAGSNLELFDLATPASSSGSAAPDSSPYATLLRAAMFGTPTRGPGRAASSTAASSWSTAPHVGTPNKGNIFRFKADVPRNSKRALFACGHEEGVPLTATGAARPRKIPRSPYRTLDAPGLQDSFYLNLLDWSTRGLLAVGLGNCIYVWNSNSDDVTMLCDLGDDDSACSVRWTQRGTHLAVGTDQGTVQIWDASRCKRIRTIGSHKRRVGSLAWSSSLLSSGGADSTILHHDIRAREDYVGKLTGHYESEVCGLQWSCDNSKLASGGNDNRLCVWDPRYGTVLEYKEHKAAVEAIAWSPHQHGLLASGGGTEDSCIRFWNTATDTQLSCTDTWSQVCNLVWSKSVNELVSTHGYRKNPTVSTHGQTQHQINVWRYPKMAKVAALTGHVDRVLYLAISPDGQNVVTGAGGYDQALRFWNVFPPSKSQSSECLPGSTSSSRSYIR